jgi:hypothetical protein
MAAVSHIEKALVVDNLEICWLGRGFAVIGLPLDKVATPFHSIPGILIRRAIQGNGTGEFSGEVLLFYGYRIGWVTVCGKKQEIEKQAKQINSIHN